MIVCRKCKQTKNASNFAKDKNRKNGIKTICKSCMNKQYKERMDKKLDRNQQESHVGLRNIFEEEFIEGKPKFKETDINILNESKFFNDVILYYKVENLKSNNVDFFIDKIKNWIGRRILTGWRKKYKRFKLQINPVLLFIHPITNEKTKFYKNTTPTLILTKDDFNMHIIYIKDFINDLIDKTELRGSGWIFQYIESADIILYDISLEAGSSYIECNLKNIINPQNEDNLCFLYCILIHYYKDQIKNSKQRISNYKQYITENNLILPNNKIITYKDFEFPMSIEQLKKFEKRNDFLSINVFKISESDNTKLNPYYRTNNRVESNKINLLFIANEKTNHYIYIKNLAKLIDGRENYDFICHNCLITYTKENALITHEKLCYNNNAQRLIIPKEKTIKFNDYYMKSKLDFFMFYDFECMLKPYEDKSKSSENKYQKHEANSFGLYLYINQEQIKKSGYYSFFGENCVDKFIELIMRLFKEFAKIFNNKTKNPVEIIFTGEGKKIFDSKTNCEFCNKKFADNKCRDHCHFSGKYRYALCSDCNLIEGKRSKIIPIYAHNAMNYDSNLIIKKLSAQQNKYIKLDLLPTTTQKYISFTLRNISSKIKFIFLDSNKFFVSSLDNVAKSMNDEDFKITRNIFKDEDKFQLVRKKGIYPYCYIDNINRLNESRLPPKEKFYSDLTMEEISEKDYEHAKIVWDTFKCKNLKEYHMLYLKIDVLLLTDCFLNFRKMIYDNFEIEIGYSHTLPGCAWRSMLKKTNIEIETLQDPDMILLFENLKKGGISLILGDRHCLANNKYIEGFDKNLPSNFIFYIDQNNLYGNAMSENLPLNNLKWENEDYYYTGKPCFVECDLIYTNEAKMKTWKYPLMPEKVSIKEEDLSPYQIDLLKKKNLKNSKHEKLILNLNDKEKYVVYYKNLQFYESMGVKIKKIHRTISFHEEPWMKNYIEQNTKNRMKSNSDFEKNNFKLLNNAPYGKTFENIRDRIKIKFPETAKSCKYYANQINFEGANIIDNEMIIFKMKEKEIYFDKPIHVGAIILEISKLIMHKSYYGLINNLFPINFPLYTDSVTEDTPIILKRNNKIYIEKICNITDNFQEYENEKFRAQINDIEVLTSNGFQKLNYVMKHQTNKKIYRITVVIGWLNIPPTVGYLTSHYIK